MRKIGDLERIPGYTLKGGSAASFPPPNIERDAVMTEVLELERWADEPRFVTVKLKLPSLELPVEYHFLARTGAEQDQIRGVLVRHKNKNWGEIPSLLV
jgi:hypothetical protein